ncbi:MAG TPA: PEP/pyruvate-binding domain-containing protein, partial [Bryobacteraceae bacterium]|nr:PEP/pyruvate-binding domain-containing protein [Bryobacteraceae bacterium]
GIPFVYLVEAAERARVQTLVGREIILRSRENASLERVKIVDVEETMSAGFREELLALKAPVGIDITPKAVYGAFSASTTNLVPADIRYFGGKAANFGFLRRTVPTNSPDAIAFSFDLWDAFLNQTMFDGRALRAHLNERLAGYTYPPNISTLTADLEYVRDLIRQSARFTAAQQQAITNALRQFDASRKIRFRSSTNVEDAQNFIGAGLYDSYSGCLLDDRDGDSAGPSHCDPEEDGERGVFRAIQRVYASFYNDNAFIERLRLRVNESQVGMAVLVHYSFPDEIEMANGVATVEVNRSFSGNVTLVADLNTQIGATSVTNPDGTSQPEVVHVRQSSSGVTLSFVQGSSLIPRGAYVMNWESDYRALMELVAKVCDGYISLYTNRTRFNLDFEYKKVQPHGYLELKQVREIPVPAVTNLPGAYLIANPHTYHVTQGECGSPFSVHRLKSVLQLHSRNVRLDQTNFTFIGQMSFECFDGTNLITLAGQMGTLSNHIHSVDVRGSHDSWTMTVGSNRWDITLDVSGVAPSFVSSADPIRFLTDYRLTMAVRYGQPVFDLDSTGNRITVTNDGVCLEVPRTVGLADPPRSAHFDGTNGFSILAEYWTPNLSSAGIIKTIPLLAWNRTHITGLTSQPLILTNYYSQSFRPGHHNFYEDYVFEPRLDSNVTPQQQSELAAANVRLLVFRYDPPTSVVWALGLDDTVRQLK